MHFTITDGEGSPIPFVYGNRIEPKVAAVTKLQTHLKNTKDK